MEKLSLQRIKGTLGITADDARESLSTASFGTSMSAQSHPGAAGGSKGYDCSSTKVVRGAGFRTS